MLTGTLFRKKSWQTETTLYEKLGKEIFPLTHGACGLTVKRAATFHLPKKKSNSSLVKIGLCRMESLTSTTARWREFKKRLEIALLKHRN